MDYKQRCQDCACLIEKNGIWCCDECFGQKCEDVTDCPYGADEQALAEMDRLQKVKVDHGHAQAKRKQTKPRTVKVSDEKKQLFSEIYQNLLDIYGENAEIVKMNKIIMVNIGDKHFKIDLIEQRKSK